MLNSFFVIFFVILSMLEEKNFYFKILTKNVVRLPKQVQILYDKIYFVAAVVRKMWDFIDPKMLKLHLN